MENRIQSIVLLVFKRHDLRDFFIVGTAFVQFKTKTDAENFRSAAEEEEVGDTLSYRILFRPLVGCG